MTRRSKFLCLLYFVTSFAKAALSNRSCNERRKSVKSPNKQRKRAAFAAMSSKRYRFHIQLVALLIRDSTVTLRCVTIASFYQFLNKLYCEFFCGVNYCFVFSFVSIVLFLNRQVLGPCFAIAYCKIILATFMNKR